MTRKRTIYTLRQVLTIVLLLGASFGASCGDATAVGVWDEANQRAYLKDVQWDDQITTGSTGTLPVDCIDRRMIDTGYGNMITSVYEDCYSHNGFVPYDEDDGWFSLFNTIIDLTHRDYGGRGKGFTMISRPEQGLTTKFTISVYGDTNGNYRVTVRITKWTGLPPRPSCSLKAANIDLGPVGPDEIRTGGSILTIKCNVDTGVTVKVGGRDGSADVPYAPGGVVRMSFAESQGGGSNVYRVQAKKNQSLDATLRATTVPGSAAPGTYTASAVVTAELQ